MDGYCLQYHDEDVRRVLLSETMWWNYEAVDFVPVRYGVKTDDATFKELAWQISQQYLRQIYEATKDHRLELEVDSWMAQGVMFRRLLEFCAFHKDPMYKDEREYRIFAYPSPRAEARTFSGIARVKRIETSPLGKRYISLAADIRPGFVPFRIMCADKASVEFGDLLDGSDIQPRFEQVELPVTG